MLRTHSWLMAIACLLLSTGYIPTSDDGLVDGVQDVVSQDQGGHGHFVDSWPSVPLLLVGSCAAEAGVWLIGLYGLKKCRRRNRTCMRWVEKYVESLHAALQETSRLASEAADEREQWMRKASELERMYHDLQSQYEECADQLQEILADVQLYPNEES